MALKRIPHEASLGDHLSGYINDERRSVFVNYDSQETAAWFRAVIDAEIQNQSEAENAAHTCTGCGAEINNDTGLCYSCNRERAFEEAAEFRRGDD